MKALLLALLLPAAVFAQTNTRSPTGVWTPVVASPDGTIVKAGTTATLTDAAGIVWGINASGQVTMNGAPDLSTWAVAAIGIKAGIVEQVNTAGAGYDKAVSQWGVAKTPWVSQPAPPTAFSVRVNGNNIVNGNGTPMQLRGVNISSLEGTPFQNDPWRGQTPNWAAIKSWGVNVVRLTLGEANWLGLCSQTLAAGVTPAIYQQTVQTAVTNANAQGMYVILDLHWIAVPNSCPQGQNAMADVAHSPTFWSQVAAAYKGNQAVMFELFNEPQGNYPPTTADWNNYVTGGLTGSQDAGTQQLVNAIRAAGASNVIIVDGLNYASTFGNNNPAQTGYTDNPPGFRLPTDTVSPAQLVAGFHYYHGSTYEQGANVVLNKGIPIMVTEFGDQNNQSGDSQSLFGWADPNGRAAKALTSGGSAFPGVSYLGWTWDAWGGVSSFILITDAAGDPTQGYGSYVKTHYLCRAAGTC